MHGRKTSQREEKDPSEVKQARAAKYQQYLQACQAALSSETALRRSEKLLRYNPDFSTLWNARRRDILERLVDEGTSARQQMLQLELELTQQQIAERNSKSYGAWYHRRWAVSTIVSSTDSKRLLVDLAAEFALCDGLLQRDERNFHCWHYRNFLLSLTTTGRDEVLFDEQVVQKSRALIERNFSNYSAWHLRVQAIRGSSSNRVVDWVEELDLAHQAMFTEPADQSAWLYYRWVLKRAQLAQQALREERDLILSLLEDEGKDCKWPLLALVQLAALCVEGEGGEEETVTETAQDYCARLTQVDALHGKFYAHLSALFQQGQVCTARQVLFGV